MTLQIFHKRGLRIAYDICAVNTVLNYYSEKLGLEFDKGGKIARNGTLISALFEELEKLAFYSQPLPKSLGIEWVHENVFLILKNYEKEFPSILNTYCQHIASEIAKNIEYKMDYKVLVTGGGAFNTYLMEFFRRKQALK